MAAIYSHVNAGTNICGFPCVKNSFLSGFGDAAGKNEDDICGRAAADSGYRADTFHFAVHLQNMASPCGQTVGDHIKICCFIRQHKLHGNTLDKTKTVVFEFQKGIAGLLFRCGIAGDPYPFFCFWIFIVQKEKNRKFIFLWKLRQRVGKQSQHGRNINDVKPFQYAVIQMLWTGSMLTVHSRITAKRAWAAHACAFPEKRERA